MGKYSIAFGIICTTANQLDYRVPDRRCFLVSRPIESVSPEAKVTHWRVIGNSRAVPKLNERLPFIEHWALCVLPSESGAKTSDPSAREAFLNADYFDLGVSEYSAFQSVSKSDSYMSFLNSSTKWTPAAVMDISSVVEIGGTARSNDWILERARYLIRNWGTYRPFLWNCQHFAVFIAQITTATKESASTINSIMSARRKFVFSIRASRRMGCEAGMVFSFFVPVVGTALAASFWATAGIRTVMDWMKTKEILPKWNKFREKYGELRQIHI